MTEESEKTSIESLLRESLCTLRNAMQCRDPDTFDESTDTIEMLISYDTKAYKDIMVHKSSLQQTLRTAMENIKLNSVNCSTTISKRKYIQTNQYRHEWIYRKNYLFKIISIFISRSILESEKPSPVKIAKVKS